MECPVCKRKEHQELDTHVEGFAQNLIECGDCGTLWTTEVIKQVRPVVVQTCRQMPG